MTTHHPDTLQREIDRLVGGELDKPATRALVERLNADADGWKRCALAYMEAESWRRAFGALVEEVPIAGPAETAIPASPAATISRSRRIGAAIMAACVLLGVAVGISAVAGWNRWRGESAENAPNGIAGPDHRDNAAPSNRELNPVRREEDKQNPKPLVGLVQVSANGVPETAFAVVGVKGAEAENVDFAPAELPDYDRTLWERRGYRVEQHRKVVSVLLADGNRLQFPIDWTNLRYVGERVY